MLSTLMPSSHPSWPSRYVKVSGVPKERIVLQLLYVVQNDDVEATPQ